MAKSLELALGANAIQRKVEPMGRGNFSLEASWGKFVERTPVIYLSLGLIAIGGWLVWKFPGGYFWHSIGEAAIIAALLMFLVDPFLRARLLKEAARDIFEYVLGFDHQPQLKERLRRLVFDTKLFRKNFNARYKLIPQEDFIQIEMEFDFELVNPTEEAIEFQYKVDFDQAESPRLDSLSLICSEVMSGDPRWNLRKMTRSWFKGLLTPWRFIPHRRVSVTDSEENAPSVTHYPSATRNILVIPR